MTDNVEVLIIGGGVGGLTLAQWLTGLGRSWRIVEREAYLGGPLAHSQYVLKWIPGWPAVSGRDYMAAILAGIDTAHCELSGELTQIEMDEIDPGWRCQLSNGRGMRAKKLVFACGAAPVSPFAPAERVIVGPGLQKIAHLQTGHRVLVLGGGDNAAEHALILQEMGCSVVMLVRSALRASAVLAQQLRAAQIDLRVHGDALPLNVSASGVELFGESYDYAAVYYGYQPSTAATVFPLLYGPDQRISRDVFILGDMSGPSYPNILLTQGQAAVVAKQIDHALSGD
ncbi:FAD-dependent oxidoreductase [uncultured Deefgea sp.]|uniref:FAD-dependent oxidoreductase n=1 Tax=uncultured Deefgea sp. TaxID=1304914 RepID=UPI00259A45E6|nr:FAD-dependent oxidoreductase [uncultured Deefgea sp.]